MKWLTLIPLFFSIESFAREVYLAKFTTITPHVNGMLAGSSTVYINRDRLLIYNRLFGGAPNAWHMQNVYTGTRCPTIEDDTNFDGIIDIVEGNKVWGNILIPMDTDLNSQMAGQKEYPIADPYGYYFYEKQGSYSRMMKDLKARDKNPDDNIVKLPPPHKLNLEGKVVLIQGVSENFVLLPDTVASSDNMPVHQTLPIACGILKKTKRL